MSPRAALPHPATVLYTLAAAWAAVVAGIALAGPWRRSLGPVVGAAVTAGVIALETYWFAPDAGNTRSAGPPWSGPVLRPGNIAVVLYGTAGILVRRVAGGAALRTGARGRAVRHGAVTIPVVATAAWPGFRGQGRRHHRDGARLPRAARRRGQRAVDPTPRALAAVSGLALVTIFALINYLIPGTGHSDIGHFAGQVLHGGAGRPCAAR